MNAVRPLQTYVVIDHLYRDRYTADQAVEGIFTNAGVTLNLGLQPDWCRDGLAGDKEWRIEWVKAYFGLDLAHCFAETGDTRYLLAWQQCLEGWLEQVPCGFDSSDVSARRLQNWAYAWQRFAASPHFNGLPAELEQRLLRTIGADLDHLAANLTAERNHRTMELYTLFIVPLALTTLDPTGSRIRFALDELQQNLVTDIWPDGVHRECCSDYHMIALRTFLGVMANSAMFGLELPQGFRERVSLACDFAMHLQRPDGLTPALSDGDVGDYRPLLMLSADLLQRDDLRWVATRGAEGTAPEQLQPSFGVGGYAFQRSGWGASEIPFANELYCVIDCGPLGDGGHGHYDCLSVEIAAGGQSLVVDPGRFTYADDPQEWRRWFKGTAGHNTVTVDGLDQTPYRRSRPIGPVAGAQLLSRHSLDGFDVVEAEVTSPVYSASHRRQVVFVDRKYWLIVDHLNDDTAHTYEQRWHLATEANGNTHLAERDNRNLCMIATTPGMTMAFAAVSAGLFDVAIEPGWVSPTYGVKHPAPVLVASSAGHPRAIFVTVIAPTPISISALQATAFDVGAINRTAVIDIGHEDGSTDIVVLGDTPVSILDERISTALGWIRLDSEGCIERGALRADSCPAGMVSVKDGWWAR